MGKKPIVVLTTTLTNGVGMPKLHSDGHTYDGAGGKTRRATMMFMVNPDLDDSRESYERETLNAADAFGFHVRRSP